MSRKVLAWLGIRHWSGLKRAPALNVIIGAEIFALLVVGAWDFRDALRQSEQLATAAWTGARYGIQNPERWTDYAGMIQAARGGAKDTSNNLTIVAQQVCLCPGGGVISCREICAGEAYSRVYVQVTVSKKFVPPLSGPLAGSLITLSSHAMLRVK